MGSVVKLEPTSASSSTFKDDVYVAIIDKLRELGITELVSLPQVS
jgi:hypothetical protein